MHLREAFELLWGLAGRSREREVCAAQQCLSMADACCGLENATQAVDVQSCTTSDPATVPLLSSVSDTALELALSPE